MDEMSREFGKLETRVSALEESDKDHKETGRDYRKWKNIIIGMIIIVGQITVLAGWLITKYLP